MIGSVYTGSFMYTRTRAHVHACAAVQAASVCVGLFAVVLIAVREIASIGDLEANRRIVPVAVISKSSLRSHC